MLTQGMRRLPPAVAQIAHFNASLFFRLCCCPAFARPRFWFAKCAQCCFGPYTIILGKCLGILLWRPLLAGWRMLEAIACRMESIPIRLDLNGNHVDAASVGHRYDSHSCCVVEPDLPP